MRATPLAPSTTRVQNAGTPIPSAETAPSPVMATRRTSMTPGTPERLGASGLFLDQRPQSLDDLADGLHRVRRVVGHDDLEFVFEGEEQVGGVERIDPHLLERARRRHARRIQLFLPRDDVDDPLFECVRHNNPQSRAGSGAASMIIPIIHTDYCFLTG